MARKKNVKSGNKGGNKQQGNKGNVQPQVVSRSSGSGSVKQSGPTAQSISLSTSFGIRNDGSTGDITTTGSEIVGVAAGVWSGKMCFVADMNPVTWVGTRIAQMVGLYETYFIKELRVTYIPACPTTTGGLIYMYYDRDPSDSPIPSVSDPGNLTKLMGNQNAVAGQAWRPLVMSYRPNKSDLNGYYAAPVSDSGDLRLTSQGMIYAYTSVPSNAVIGGLFKFDYVISLRTPTGPNLTKSPTTPFSYGASSLATKADSAPVSPVISPGFPMINAVVYQVLLDYAVQIVVEGRVMNLEPYTNVFMRSIGSVWRTYNSMSSAVAGGNDGWVGPSVGATGNAWVRRIVNLVTGETTA